jgi:hypothetical protein
MPFCLVVAIPKHFQRLFTLVLKGIPKINPILFNKSMLLYNYLEVSLGGKNSMRGSLIE